MKGLIYRDMISFFRRTSKVSWFFDLVFMVVFLLPAMKFGVATYLLLYQPVNVSGAASTLKELDTNYNGRFILTLPVSHSQHVLSRFASAYAVMLLHLAECIVFVLLHYLFVGQYPLSTYLFYLAAGILIGIALTAFNTLTTFIMGLNATALVYLGTIVLVFIGYIAFLFFDIDFRILLELSNLQLLALGTALTIVIFAVCYYIAKKIYIKKLG